MVTERIPVAGRLLAAWDGLFMSDWSSRSWIRARVASLVFVLFLLAPLRDAWHRGWAWPVKALVFAGVGVFVACFARVVWRNTPLLNTNRSPWAIVVAAAVGLPLVPALGTPWLTLMGVYCVAMLLFNCPSRYWPLVVLGGPAVALLVGRFALPGGRVPWALAVQIALTGAVMAAFYRQIRAKIELGHARAELARLAVSEERLRIARDLHDILGQRLSAVSLKAELAARLVDRDPRAAAAEMLSVAEVARGALEDVRHTVTGYRSVSLGGEVETARALLTAADVRLVTDLPVEPLPAARDECAAWLVREATTNVVRHADAHNCHIAVRPEMVEVRNDGGTPTSVAAGTGLSGLGERVEAAGGKLWIGAESGWFVVRASFTGGSA